MQQRPFATNTDFTPAGSVVAIDPIERPGRKRNPFTVSPARRSVWFSHRVKGEERGNRIQHLRTARCDLSILRTPADSRYLLFLTISANLGGDKLQIAFQSAYGRLRTSKGLPARTVLCGAATSGAWL